MDFKVQAVIAFIDSNQAVKVEDKNLNRSCQSKKLIYNITHGTPIEGI
jgi:hypothetical protein